MYDFPCPRPVDTHVRIGAGTVEIFAEDRDTATVDVQPHDNSEASHEAVERTRVEMRDGRLLVETPDAKGFLLRRSPRIRIYIRVPNDGGLQLNTASADASVHGRHSSAAVNSASGDVYLEQVTGDVALNTASGNARITEVGGNLSVNSASGDVTAQVVGGETSFKTASGDVHVEQAGGGVKANTASGNVRIGAARRGDVRVNSASGDVSVGVAAGTGVWLDLKTLSGSTRTDLAMENAPPQTGNPELSVHVNTMSGDIEVRRVTMAANA